MSVKERIKEFIKIQHLTVLEFEKLISASNGYVNSISKSIGIDKIGLILEKFPNINLEWLLTGKGTMFKEGNELNPEPFTAVVCEPGVSSFLKPNEGVRIPLVTPQAVAGFGSSSFAIAERDVKEYYVVPKFRHSRIDFMIEISGSSMYPKYNSGDVVACTILKEKSFIQWNKCHVIATRGQGILVKRIRPAEDEDNIIAVSDNPDYPPFAIPKVEINGIAIVVGVIRLE